MITDAFCEKDNTVTWSHAISNKETLSTQLLGYYF